MPATDTQLEKFGKKKRGLRGFMGKIQSNTPKGVANKLSPKRVHSPFSSSATSTEMTRPAENRDFPVSPPAPSTGGDANSSHAKQSTGIAEKVESSAKDTKVGGDASESSLDTKEVDMPKPDKELHLKVEILSCRGLIVADKTTSDPYVKVRPHGCSHSLSWQMCT
jgi:hypothetical protein